MKLRMITMFEINFVWRLGQYINSCPYDMTKWTFPYEFIWRPFTLQWIRVGNVLARESEAALCVRDQSRQKERRKQLLQASNTNPPTPQPHSTSATTVGKSSEKMTLCQSWRPVDPSWAVRLGGVGQSWRLLGSMGKKLASCVLVLRCLRGWRWWRSLLAEKRRGRS